MEQQQKEQLNTQKNSETFKNILATLNNNLKNLSISTFLTSGDFNWKVGKVDDFETCDLRSEEW